MILTAALLMFGFIHTWKIAEIEASPLLAVCTVEQLSPGDIVPPDSLKWKRPARYWNAVLRVHRAFGRTAPSSGERITLQYVTYEDLTGGVSGSPIWPMFKIGDLALFPLTPSKTAHWTLTSDEGFNLTVPATEKAWTSGSTPTSGRDFILRELTNTLANGSPKQQADAAAYLRQPGDTMPPELRPLLEAALGQNDDRWLSVSAALLSALGVPRPKVSEFMEGKSDWMPQFSDIYRLVSWTLERGAKRDYPNRLVRLMVRDADAHAWGSAVTLTEFKNSPVLIEELEQAYREGHRGSLEITSFLVRDGQQSILPAALPFAERIVSQPADASMSELQSAGGLIREYGSDTQFEELLATLRRLKTTDEDQYRKLWSASAYSNNKRELRMAAILIGDKRAGFGQMRYCDVAAASVEHVSGEKFGIAANMPVAEKDQIVGRVALWLRSQRIAIP